MNLRWFSKYFLAGPAKFQSPPNSFNVGIKSLAQFCNRSSDTKNGKYAIAARVPVLGRVGLPFAIAWLVILVAIYSSEGQSAGNFTKVREEILKVRPSVTYLNPFSSVKLPFLIFGIPAPIVHLRPSFIRRGLIASSGVTVLNDIGHGIGSFNVMFSDGCSAVTGTRCDHVELV